MFVGNRPDQGLVLDASPLEMVKIQELDAVLHDEEKGFLWVEPWMRLQIIRIWGQLSGLLTSLGLQGWCYVQKIQLY
ncbi:hypothetical protein Peur_008447 [Populus x canadensis]